MENCSTTPAGTGQPTGIGKNAFEGRPEDYANFCHALIAGGLMPKGGEPHPWTTSPLPDPVSGETVSSLLYDSQANRIPEAFIHIVLFDKQGHCQRCEIHGRLLTQVSKAAGLLAHSYLPAQYRLSRNKFLPKLFDPVLRNNAALAIEANRAGATALQTSLFPRDPVQSCLYSTLLAALCYKDYNREEPITIYLHDSISVAIPCPLPLAPMPSWYPEYLGRVLALRDIPSSCNAELVRHLCKLGLIDCEYQGKPFELANTSWAHFGYRFSDPELRYGELRFLLNCVS